MCLSPQPLPPPSCALCCLSPCFYHSNASLPPPLPTPTHPSSSSPRRPRPSPPSSSRWMRPSAGVGVGVLARPCCISGRWFWPGSGPALGEPGAQPGGRPEGAAAQPAGQLVGQWRPPVPAAVLRPDVWRGQVGLWEEAGRGAERGRRGSPGLPPVRLCSLVPRAWRGLALLCPLRLPCLGDTDCFCFRLCLRGVSVTGLKVWRTTHLAIQPRWPAWCTTLLWPWKSSRAAK
jgi:hypothetical protein